MFAQHCECINVTNAKFSFMCILPHSKRINPVFSKTQMSMSQFQRFWFSGPEIEPRFQHFFLKLPWWSLMLQWKCLGLAAQEARAVMLMLESLLLQPQLDGPRDFCNSVEDVNLGAVGDSFFLPYGLGNRGNPHCKKEMKQHLRWKQCGGGREGFLCIPRMLGQLPIVSRAQPYPWVL